MKLTVREAATMLDVSETRIYQWVDQAAIPFTMIQQRPRFHRVELLEWAIDEGLTIGLELIESLEPTPLASALQRGGAVVIASVSELGRDLDLDVPDGVAITSDVSRLVARNGLASPRARCPIIRAQTSPLARLYWCVPPLVIDELPVSAALLIVAPTVGRHLELVARLSLLSQNAELVAAAERVDRFAELVAAVAEWEQSLSRGAS